MKTTITMRFSFLYFSILTLAGCTQPIPYIFYADFRNSCDYPVQVTALNYTYSDNAEEYTNDTARLNRLLASGETVGVLHFNAFGNDVQRLTPDNYSLVISAKGNQRTLDKAQFLRVIRKANDGNYWIINDQSLCP